MKVRLFLLAHGRSGDKGDAVNIGVIARRAEWYDWLVSEITAARAADFLYPLDVGEVSRYELPNLQALNFVVENALGGGGSRSLKLDAQGKTYAQALLKMPVEVDTSLWEEVKMYWGDSLLKDCLLET